MEVVKGQLSANWILKIPQISLKVFLRDRILQAGRNCDSVPVKRPPHSMFSFLPEAIVTAAQAQVRSR